MYDLQKQFHDYVASKNLFTKDEKILLAVSGGLDSMVLLELFSRSEFSFEVAHCNFQLRGEESDGDQDFVEDYCKRKSIKLHSKRFVVEKDAIQVDARRKRYQWFAALQKDEGLDKIATAHHLNDSIETIFINLLRGTGARGLRGIMNRFDVIRPLLFASRDNIATYAEALDLKWREDSSNQKLDYQRNVLRQKVLPVLKELKPELAKAMGNTFERMTLTQQLIDQLVEDRVRKSFDQELNRLEINWLNEEKDMLILHEILRKYGVNFSTAKEIFSARKISGKKFFGDGFTVFLDRDSLTIQSSKSVLKADFEIPAEGTYETDWGVFEIRKSFDIRVINAHHAISIDASLVKFPLKVRAWAYGDRFVPLGMKGKKKVSDFMIDRKIPVVEKTNIPVLDSEGKIFWVVGQQISDHVKISQNTQEIMIISMIKNTQKD